MTTVVLSMNACHPKQPSGPNKCSQWTCLQVTAQSDNSRLICFIRAAKHIWSWASRLRPHHSPRIYLHRDVEDRVRLVDDCGEWGMWCVYQCSSSFTPELARRRSAIYVEGSHFFMLQLYVSLTPIFSFILWQLCVYGLVRWRHLNSSISIRKSINF